MTVAPPGRRWRIILGALGGVAAMTCAARADSIHLYSYDPADPATRRAAGPVTFTLRKGLLRDTVLNLRSTNAPATAYLRRVDDKGLGPGGLRGALGQTADRDLYEVEPADDGQALIAALCPGYPRAWMAFSPLKLNRDLTVEVLGKPGGAGKVKLCHTLSFSFHGEWLLPPGRTINPRELERGRYPGS